MVTAEKGHNSGFVSMLLNFLVKAVNGVRRLILLSVFTYTQQRNLTLSLVVILQEGEKPELTVLWLELVN